MEWLWIPAVALVSVFLLVLCCVFFKDYTCCPCRRKRPLTPDDVEAAPPPPAYNVPRSSGYRSPRPSAPPPRPPSRLSSISSVHSISSEISREAPFTYNFRGIVSANDAVKIQNGIPELDLHTLRVWEARQVTQMFLKQSRGRHRRVRIITGRGLHSVGGIPKIKPEVETLLGNTGYTFREMNKGGCLEVNL